MEPILLEGRIRERDPLAHDIEHDLGIRAYLVLSMRVGPEREEVEEVMQVALPVPLGVEVERERHACKLAGELWMLDAWWRIGAIIAQECLVGFIGTLR